MPLKDKAKESISYRYIETMKKELVKEGLITSDQLEMTTEIQKSSRESIDKILVRLGFISSEKIIDFLGRHLGIPYVDLKGYLIDPKVIELVSAKLALKYQLVPLFQIEDTLTLAMVDPLDVGAIDALAQVTGLSIEPMIATEEDIIKIIQQYYSKPGEEEAVLGEEVEVLEAEVAEEKLESIAAIPPIIRLVNEIIFEAVRQRASDIHLEPEEKELPLRFRIDGLLREIKVLPKKWELAIVSRIKIMAALDITERRIPQDGSFTVTVENRPIDLRVSTFPTVFGEKVVMRVLDRQKFLLGLEQLGFSSQTMERFSSLIRMPYGIILVTGPTGSGKTTTLYAVLNTIKSVEKNIITIEDPIECALPIVKQSQINPKAGLTFATSLRSMLRQDPDIIMVGEIRDYETAEIAIRASLTGHLVFSTLHTNDALGALTRLIDMGVAPYLVSSGIVGVLAQRLVRQICSHCRESYAENKEALAELGLSTKNELKLYRGKGCHQCGGTGYHGRIGIFELATMNSEIRELVLNRSPTDVLKRAAQEAGMKTLREDAVDKVIQGITTIAEALRVTAGEE